MKLCAIEVKNWACIESLSLTGLQDGVVVLHGPNRTGKSSLMQAVRSCLFDHDHDSQKSVLLDAIPRITKAAPSVAVEFEHAGQRFRISKTFAKTKEGQATLEQQTSGAWSVVVRGKDASKRVRDLFGVETSGAGIFQMLWLGQQDFALPMPRDVDPVLTKALEAVLGTLITGRDIDFKNRLDEACGRWFTVKTMKDRKDSPVTRLGAELEDARQRLEEVSRQWTAAESALREYEEAIARQPELKRQRDEADAELQRVQQECEGVRQRSALLDVAINSRTQSERLLEQAETRLRSFEEAGRELETATRSLDNLQLEVRTAQESRVLVEKDAAAAQQANTHAEQELFTHQQARSALEDRQRLATNQVEQQAALDRIRQAEELDKKRQELEQKLVGPVVLSEAEIQALRQKRERAAALRHQLEAGEIHVSIHARSPVDIQIASDGAAAESIQLAGEQVSRWLVRQRAEVQIGALATLRIGRGEEDRNLETVARELNELEQMLRAMLVSAQLNPDDSAAIDKLVERRLHHDENTRQLKSLREQIVRAAPNGIPALHAQGEQKAAERTAILTRRPELCDWTPDQADVDQRRSEFDAAEARLSETVQEAKNHFTRLAESVRLAANVEQGIRTRIAAQEVQVRNLQERLGQQDRAALARETEEARTRLTEAQRKVDESTLTEAEQSLESQFKAVRSAYASRAERVRENEDALLRLRTQLAGAEGLHQRRIQAEQVVNDRQREWERESLYAQAHKHLKELFEQIRQEQVRRTFGPINDRVMQWARHLGLTDYQSLSFGELLPSGLVPIHAMDGEPVGIERESYGTLEQLSLLIRLAVGGLLARSESAVAILDDPLAHADPLKHRRMLDILARAARGEPHGPHPTGPLQLIVLTCHADRFDYLDGAQQFDLARLIQRGG